MRGRKPKPTALKIVQGNPGGRPLPQDEPIVDRAIPEAPVHLTTEAQEEWDRVTEQLYDAGILTGIDRASLAGYCQAYGRWVQAENAINVMGARDELTKGLMIKSAKGNPIANPLVGIANVAMRDMLRFAAEFGMTPSARSRIKAINAAAESDNPFVQLKVS